MKPDDTIAKVKDTFVKNLGRDMDQKAVRDERGFIIDPNRPLAAVTVVLSIMEVERCYYFGKLF